MAFTVQQIVDYARLTLNDADKTLYSDAELAQHVNSAFLLLQRYRPDLFVGLWASLPSSLNINSTFPNIGDMYMPVIADYVVARAESKDDEHVVQQRAQLFYQLFAAGIGTGGNS